MTDTSAEDGGTGIPQLDDQLHVYALRLERHGFTVRVPREPPPCLMYSRVVAGTELFGTVFWSPDDGAYQHAMPYRPGPSSQAYMEMPALTNELTIEAARTTSRAVNRHRVHGEQRNGVTPSYLASYTQR